SVSAPDKPILAANTQLTLKPDIPPAPRQDIRGLDWYDECDTGHFLGRDVDADRILAMLLSHPILRLVGPSGIGKSSLIRAGLLPRIREFGWRACVQLIKFNRPSMKQRLYRGNIVGKIELRTAKLNSYRSENCWYP